MSTPLAARRTEPRKNLFARLFDALIEARMRRAMREIAMYRHLIPADHLKQAGYKTTVADAGLLPFVR
jgi:hypothetical protein